MLAYLLAVAGLLGLVMGSFINCWAWRSTHGESVLEGRSHCATCGHVLGARDLVPVVSWLASGRKCRYCGDPVSARYPATELVCAAVFVGIVAVYGLSLETLELLAFAGVLLFLSLTDIDEYIIPNACIIVAMLVRVAYMAAALALDSMDLGAIGYYVASGLGIGIALVIVVLIADKLLGRESMGGGDLKLYAVAGLYFGWQQTLFLVILSCIFGIAVALLGVRGNGEAPDPQDAAGVRGNGEAPCEQDAPGAQGNGDAPGAQGGGADAAPAQEAAPTQETAPATEAAPATETAPAQEAAPATPEAPATPDPQDAADPAPAEDEGVMKRAIPFGPSIAAACVVTMLVGEGFITWYMGFLL